MMSCEEFTSLVTDFLDGRVPHGKKLGMLIHRLMCVRCRNYLRQIRELVVFVGTHDEPPSIDLGDEARSELLRRFREVQGEG